MAEEMGMENIFIFGMKENEVEDLKKRGYNAFDYYHRNAELRQAIDQIGSGFFCPYNHDEFRDVFNNLMYHDRFFCLADYEAYIDAQDKVNETYQVAFTFMLHPNVFFFFWIIILIVIVIMVMARWIKPYTVKACQVAFTWIICRLWTEIEAFWSPISHARVWQVFQLANFDVPKRNILLELN